MTYFWLLKFYILTCASVIVVYSIYLTYETQVFCADNLVCVNFLGVKVVSNEKLWELIRDSGDLGKLNRLFSLRAVAFVILLFANAFSLFIVSRFKKRYPMTVSYTHLTLPTICSV